MLLKRVIIENFRSIEYLRIDFDQKCRILVGINESGKSNILKALSMLSEDREPSKEDIREVLPDEPPVEKAYIKFIFSFDDTEIYQIYENVKSGVLTTNNNLPILKKDGENITLEQFCKMKQEKLYVIDVLNKKRYTSSWKIAETYETLGNLKNPSHQCPENFVIQDANGKSVPLKKYAVDEDYWKDIPPEYLSDISFKDVDSDINKITDTMIKENLPEVIYWTYSDVNLLPPHIDIAQFAAIPTSCMPLKYMFELAKIADINKAIEDAKLASANALRNLLNRVAEATTKHFHNVWKEYKTITFHLILDGNNINASVKDEFNHYEFSMRSDGFKRFATFLLLISTRVKTNQLQNALLLIDEPEMSLHPSGARYLKDELIKISKNNFVVYSTHSIFMIDRDNINRNLIVKKGDEKTSVIEVDESNIIDEEVIYNALGYSIFESLKKKNIVFEGWRDKRLCEVAIQKLPPNYKHLKNTFKEIGLCHAKGVKDISHITPLLELANRECLILSDDDKVSEEKQKEYIKNKGCGIWKRYSEVLPDIEAITGEDFIKTEAFHKPIDTIRKNYPSLEAISDFDLSNKNGKIYALQNWLRKGQIDNNEQKIIIDSIKENIFENLKPSHIEPVYYKYLKKLTSFLRKE
jgi:predicted ATP-dependent endonuclease of OLD family